MGSPPIYFDGLGARGFGSTIVVLGGAPGVGLSCVGCCGGVETPASLGGGMLRKSSHLPHPRKPDDGPESTTYSQLYRPALTMCTAVPRATPRPRS